MSQTLYEEAIAEARRLTEMAEQNAKNKIIEAVTPQIRMLIERELMGEDDELDDSDDELDDDDLDGEVSDMATIDLDTLSHATPTSQLKTPTSSGASVSMNNGVVQVKVDGVNIEVEPSSHHHGDGDGELLLDKPMSESHLGLSSRISNRIRMNERVKKLRVNVELLRAAISEAREVGTIDQKRAMAKIFESLAREAVTLQNQVIFTQKNTGGRSLETKLVSSIIKEMKDMSRRNNKNAFDFLFEAEGDDEMGTEASAEGGTDSGAVADAVESFLASLKAAGIEGIEVPGSEEAEEAEASEEPEEADEVSEADEPYEMHENEVSKDSKDSEDSEDSEDPVSPVSEIDELYEIDESALRTELRRLRGLNESDAVDGSGASSFGGGKAGDDMFVDVDEDSLLNALADELGTAKMPKVGKMKESAAAAKATVNEVAALRSQVQDYKNVAEQLKKQLVEMNLFNAKLLYANKLMQNREITAKQQRAIVEALDNAKTLREAKLLYKSLTTSLNKVANKGNLAEGRDLRTLGSSSKSARSAQPAAAAINESGSMDRWALLAGIKKD